MKDALIGRTIVDVRLAPDILFELTNTRRPLPGELAATGIVLVLDDGNLIVPFGDDDGNTMGYMDLITKDGTNDYPITVSIPPEFFAFQTHVDNVGTVFGIGSKTTDGDTLEPLPNSTSTNPHTAWEAARAAAHTYRNEKLKDREPGMTYEWVEALARQCWIPTPTKDATTP